MRPERFGAHRSCVGLGLAAAFLLVLELVGARSAAAHGEHNLEPFIRMRGITFLNVSFSRDRLALNETLTISGKFRLMEAWPRTLPVPELAYLNVLVPGPRLGVVERRINGQFMQNSFHIEPGRLYDFELVLRAREAGEWHVHPLVNLEETGAMVGPGRYVTVEATGGPPTRLVTLATGETIDLEAFGFGRVVGWHLAFLALGIAWIVFWVARPLVVRFVFSEQGAEKELVRPRDRWISGVLAGATAVVTLGGLWTTYASAPSTIPHQVGDTWELPSTPQPSAVATETTTFRYDPRTRTMTLEVEVTNRSGEPVRLRKFATSYLTFVAEDTLELLGGKEEPVPPMMQVEPSGPIPPGETRSLTLRMQDSVWETDNFINYQQPQVTAAGLLVFVRAELSADLQPVRLTLTNDLETPGTPWEEVVSVNEVFETLRVDFGRLGT